MSDRKKYIEKIEDQLKYWDSELDLLEEKMNRRKGDLKQKYERELAEIKVKRRELAVKLNGLKMAGDDVWDDLADRFEESWAELKTSFEAAKNQFKKQ